jgi:hypothetical protein
MRLEKITTEDQVRAAVDPWTGDFGNGPGERRFAEVIMVDGRMTAVRVGRLHFENTFGNPLIMRAEQPQE